MKKLSVEDYIKALERMKRSPRDRIGILGELGAAGLGVTAGLAISGAAATAAGAATLAGSTTLASLLGGVFVTATPVGWVVGSAIAGGALALATAKAIRSGSKADQLKVRTIQELEERIQALRQAALHDEGEDQKIAEVITSVQLLVANRRITQSKGTELLVAVEAKRIGVVEALDMLSSLISEQERNQSPG